MSREHELEEARKRLDREREEAERRVQELERAKKKAEEERSPPQDAVHAEGRQ